MSLTCHVTCYHVIVVVMLRTFHPLVFHAVLSNVLSIVRLRFVNVDSLDFGTKFGAVTSCALVRCTGSVPNIVEAEPHVSRDICNRRCDAGRAGRAGAGRAGRAGM